MNLVAVGLSQQTRARPAIVHAHKVVPYGKSPSERALVKAARATQRDDVAYLANLRSPHVHIDL